MVPFTTTDPLGSKKEKYHSFKTALQKQLSFPVCGFLSKYSVNPLYSANKSSYDEDLLHKSLLLHVQNIPAALFSASFGEIRYKQILLATASFLLAAVLACVLVWQQHATPRLFAGDGGH